MKLGVITLHIFLFGFLLTGESLRAENVINFYNHNSAKTVFTDEATATASPEIGYFEKRSNKPKLEKASVSTKGQAAQSPATAAPTVMPNSKDAIVKMYGDPDQNVPLPGREDAPAPFRAMMASLELGDTELAQKYAKQYVKYLKGVQTKTDEVMALVNKAMSAEGMIQKQELLDDEAPAVVEQGFDEEKARDDVQVALKDTVPQDPFGEVDVYFFFKMDDENSRLVLPEIAAFYAVIKDDPKIKFVALSLDNASREDLQEYKDTLGITFPIRGGIKLAKKLNVSAVPATLIMTHNSPQKVVVENGFRRAFYLEEVTNLMKGKGGK